MSCADFTRLVSRVRKAQKQDQRSWETARLELELDQALATMRLDGDGDAVRDSDLPPNRADNQMRLDETEVNRFRKDKALEAEMAGMGPMERARLVADRIRAKDAEHRGH